VKTALYRKFTKYLSLQNGIGIQTIKKLYEKSGSDIKSLYDLDFERKEIPISVLKAINKSKELAGGENEIRENYICFWEEKYPEILKESYDFPAVLYFKGNYSKEIFSKCVSIVGTRNPSDYGKKTATHISSELAQLGYTIVSGMALGIDNIVHRAAYEFGTTIAVLPGSVNNPVPKTNSNTYQSILNKDGLVISDNESFEVIPSMYVRRNRIVAGLSKATIVVEGSETSGSLITADLAFDYDRIVFAVPGRIDSLQSMGPNKLISSNKAKIFTSLEDFILELDPNSQISKPKKKNLDALDSKEKEVYLLIEGGIDNADIIVREVGSEISVVLNILTILELKNYIQRIDNNKYISL